MTERTEVPRNAWKGTAPIVKLKKSGQLQGHAAWAYLVVSSEQQADTLDDQQAWADRTARAHGWEITRWFKDTSTGKSGARKLLDDLVEALRAMKPAERPARVLMTRLDRLGRGDGLEPIEYFAKIRTLGPVIHTREDGDNAIHRASDALKPILRVLTGALENEARRDKMIEKWRNWKAGGRKGLLRPYGIATDEHGHDVALEPQAEFVRKAFQLRVQGLGHVAIGNYLREHAPPMIYKNPRKKLSEHRMRWTRGSVPQMLRNEAYRGVVVDEALWDEVQFVQRWVPPKKTVKWEWPLSGTLRCYCGYSMTGQASGGSCNRCKGRDHRHERVRYYVCSERTHVGVEPTRSNQGPPTSSKPHSRFVRADLLEEKFADLLKQMAGSRSSSHDSRPRNGCQRDRDKRSRTVCANWATSSPAPNYAANAFGHYTKRDTCGTRIYSNASTRSPWKPVRLSRNLRGYGPRSRSRNASAVPPGAPSKCFGARRRFGPMRTLRTGNSLQPQSLDIAAD